MIYLLLIAVLDLIGAFFNIRMVLSCFWNKEQYPHLKKYRVITICQFVYQVTILGLNTVEVWKGLDVQLKETCSVFTVLSISMNVFLVCNLTATSVVHFHPVLYQNRKERFPKLVISAALALGFVISVTVFWFSCSTSTEDLYIYNKAFISRLWPIVLVVLVACTAGIYCNLDHTTPEASKNTWQSVEVCLKENTKTVFLLVVFLCLGVALFSFSVLNLENTKLNFAKFICLLTMDFAVGIALPVTFKDFIDSSFLVQNDKEAVVPFSLNTGFETQDI